MDQDKQRRRAHRAWTRRQKKAESADLEQRIQLARRVADRFRRNPDAIQHREEKVRHRRPVFVLNVSAGFEIPAALASNQNRQIVVVVPIRVGDSAAVNEQCIVEQRPVWLLDRLHSPEI